MNIFTQLEVEVFNRIKTSISSILLLLHHPPICLIHSIRSSSFNLSLPYISHSPDRLIDWFNHSTHRTITLYTCIFLPTHIKNIPASENIIFTLCVTRFSAISTHIFHFLSLATIAHFTLQSKTVLKSSKCQAKLKKRSKAQARLRLSHRKHHQSKRRRTYNKVKSPRAKPSTANAAKTRDQRPKTHPK